MRSKLLKSILKDAGYSLVEVVVVTAVLGVSILAWAQLANNLNRSTLIPDAQVSRDSVASLIRETLKYRATCNRALVGPGLNKSGFDAASIAGGAKEVQMYVPGIHSDDSPNDDVIGVNSKVRGLDVKSLRLVNTVALPGNKYFAQVQLQVQGANGGLALRPVDAGAFYFIVSGGGIASCESDSTDPTPICVEMGCSWDPSATPSCQCSPINLICPPQHFITGIDNSGHPICTPLGDGLCPASTYLKELRIGKSICAPLPTTNGGGDSSGGGGSPSVVNGECGVANGKSLSMAPATATELCTSGIPTAITEQWNWTCNGVNGGTSQSCSATYLAGGGSSVDPEPEALKGLCIIQNVCWVDGVGSCGTSVTVTNTNDILGCIKAQFPNECWRENAPTWRPPTGMNCTWEEFQLKPLRYRINCDNGGPANVVYGTVDKCGGKAPAHASQTLIGNDDLLSSRGCSGAQILKGGGTCGYFVSP